MKRKKKHWLWLVPAILLVVIALPFVANSIASHSLIQYIRSFEKVDYSSQIDRVVPQKDEQTGYYTLTADRDIKIMVLSDIHIGGGIGSIQQDRKTVYEVITMLQEEKPDIVLLDGDNTFAVPAPVFNGGGTLNNGMAAKDVIEIFEHEGVYFSTVFGNHDTESFGYVSRQKLAELYMSDAYEYCFFDQNFTDPEADMPSVTNQIILVKNTAGELVKALLLIDSNAYNDNTIKASMEWDYDTIHDAQCEWAAASLGALGDPGTLAFAHIPPGEFQAAYLDLEANDFRDTPTTQYISGAWDEEINEELRTRIWFGGCGNREISAQEQDRFFETLGPDGKNVLEGIFCGHDHVNNAVVNYKGVMLCCCYSLDNLAYEDVQYSGQQRGATVITLAHDGTWTQQHKNAYTDYHCQRNKFVSVYLDRQYRENSKP